MSRGRVATAGAELAGSLPVKTFDELFAEHEGPERTAEEISQLLYQVQCLMLASGLELKDVYRHL